MSRPPREPDFESGFSSPTIVDSRRLMGPNLMHSGLGAVLDVTLDDTTPERNARLLSAWHARAVFLADALYWPDVRTTQRVYAGGASLFVQAPIDQLMTATELCESAWVFAEAAEAGSADTDGGESLASLGTFARTEAQGVLRNIWNEAVRLGLNVTFDDTTLAVGTGEGCVVYAKNALPAVADIDWVALRDIPIVLVTGSNGKTTVVRMVAAMARAAGHTVGYTCTDGVWIGDSQVERGDYSGPAGARRVLQDPTVTLAVLETARGGILRRGLAVQRASVAAIVTLSADHFGGYGISDLASLADVKLVVAHAVSESGALVYNGAVPELRAAVEAYSGRVVSVRGDASDFAMTAAELAAIPATLNGTARHNVLNAAIAFTIAMIHATTWAA
jgi:cyanophycin synthetase